MSDYSLNPQQAQSIPDDMEQKSLDMKNAITSMITDLNKAESGWSGASKDYYEAARQRWQQQIDVMNGDLTQAAETLRTIIENIMNNEKNVASYYQ